MEIKISRNIDDSGLFEEYVLYSKQKEFMKNKTMSEGRLKDYLFHQVVNCKMKLVEDK
jgi:hypothetical protein|nr:MAG TPA_asm: hypothetical protein [Caudoviricetes sp.]